MSSIDKRTWRDFQSTGLLWLINRTLHVFGWAVVLTQEEDGTISDVYPARVTFRGFPTDSDDLGFSRVSKYMRDNAVELANEVENE